MMRTQAVVLVAAVGLVMGCGSEASPGQGQGEELGDSEQAVNGPDLRPTGRGIGTVSRFARKGGGGANGIAYHGGPIMLGTTDVYLIWYGGWSGNSATSILTDLASNIGGSPYFNINTTYTDGSGAHASNSVHYAGSTTDAYSQGTSLSDSAVAAVVSSAITSGRLPSDTHGIYFVLTSSDVNETSGFCTQYCGWHDNTTVGSAAVKYAFVGNPDRCPSSCAAQTTGPNGNAGADGMASIVAHELEEAVTDPLGTAWYDTRGYENADKCAWTFGTEYTVSNGAKANMRIGARDYLIQRNWVNAGGGYCAVSY
jgi:hypothetical protein